VYFIVDWILLELYNNSGSHPLPFGRGLLAGIVKTEMVVENSRVKRKVYPTSWIDLLPEDAR